MEPQTAVTPLRTPETLAWLSARLREDASLSRDRLARGPCARLGWQDTKGRPRGMACCEQRLSLHRRGEIVLPPCVVSSAKSTASSAGWR